YWASELAASGTSLGDKFKIVAQNLAQNESAIVAQINTAQGRKVDIGGYYKPDDKKASAAMRPSAIFNQILQNQIL
ncbi:NADP-dependent isocitrate dehydrogenase, partial [uncultured Campylobacter sp.]